jgi:hypothetical protein
MITKQQAEQLVYEHINAPSPQWPDMPEMIVVHTDERELGWVVYWTSRPYHETGEIQHAIAGNAPYLVCRQDGTLFETGTAPPIEERILAAEHRLKAHLQISIST